MISLLNITSLLNIISLLNDWLDGTSVLRATRLFQLNFKGKCLKLAENQTLIQ